VEIGKANTAGDHKRDKGSMRRLPEDEKDTLVPRGSNAAEERQEEKSQQDGYKISGRPL
jgi:hypothetical protein